MEGASQVFGGEDGINQSFCHNFTLIQQHGVGEAIGDLLHVVSDQHDRGRVRVGGQPREPVDEFFAAAEVESGVELDGGKMRRTEALALISPMISKAMEDPIGLEAAAMDPSDATQAFRLAATALFSESTGRVIVSVPREEDVKFRGLCDGRGYPVLRIGVTDVAADGDEPALEVQDIFTVPLTELREQSRGTLPAAFGPVIEEVSA